MQIVAILLEPGRYVQVRYGHYAGCIGVVMEHTGLTDQYWVSFGRYGQWFQEYELELIEPPMLWTDTLKDFVKLMRRQ